MSEYPVTNTFAYSSTGAEEEEEGEESSDDLSGIFGERGRESLPPSRTC